ncbi:hypothetical protein CTEN210_14825 [Chaetoceros tenuissimus]|uniref:Uncharacterized protein n=1 Tax=Chaetoceros tenuissimus TaxID=426638 RepID=A0AAD3D973_9STRA|nr:hypothetical protein CTEN210_14825 [Chaetoceros tenuissimus]
MPSLILKKTWKIKPSGFSVKNEKNFSLHGSFDESLISTLTSSLVNLKLTHNANPLRFILDDAGHYKADLNHDFQKYHEEDAIVMIMDVLEIYGWKFVHQYDQELSSEKMNGSSYTKRELFLFQKEN